MNITVDRTPKCHPEVAGEGIEYSWAHAKIYLRNIPLKDRKQYGHFKRHVHLSLSPSDGSKLSQTRVAKFSARSRDYIAAYFSLANESHDTFTALSKEDIEKMRKKYRCHRCVLDIETAVCENGGKSEEQQKLKKRRMK